MTALGLTRVVVIAALGQLVNRGVSLHGDGVAAGSPAAQKTAPAKLNARGCTALHRRVEAELAALQTCKVDAECTMTTFEYAFRPCGLGVRADADLTHVAAEAKAYSERCHPVLRPVRCVHNTRAVCEDGRCALTGP